MYAVLIILLPLSRWKRAPSAIYPSAPIFALKTQDSMTRLNATNINRRFYGKSLGIGLSHSVLTNRIHWV